MNTTENINCPACGNQLAKLTVDNIMLDICQDGCGGIWFDNYEIRHFDEKFETAGEILLNIRKNPNTIVDIEQRRRCPVCPNSVLMRHFNSIKQKIAVDECPTCGGIWLDTGELAMVREEYESDAARKEDGRKFLSHQYSKLIEAEKELHDSEDIKKPRLTDDQQRALLADNDLTEEEKEFLVKDEQSDLFNRLDKKLDKFAKTYPFLYLSYWIPGKQKWGVY